MSDMSKIKVGANTYDIKDEKSRGVPLTWAQYQALSYEEQHNGTAYYITDMDAIYPVDHELNANSRNAVANDIVTPHILAMENVLGAKNLLPFNLYAMKKANVLGTWNGNVYSYNGVNYTVNDDSVTANGTPSADSYFVFYPRYIAEYKTFAISGCPEGGSTSTYYIEAYARDSSFSPLYVVQDTGKGNAIGNAYAIDNMLCVIKQGYTASNITFYPMIRPAGTDPTYVPYAMTNAELTERISSVSPDYVGIYVALTFNRASYGVFIPLDKENKRDFSISTIDITGLGSYSQNPHIVQYGQRANGIFVTADDLPQNPDYIGCWCSIGVS